MTLATDTPAPAPSPEPAPSPAPAPVADWTTGLAPELKAVVDTKGYKSAADVITAYVNAERMIGADKIVVPKDGTWDDAARTKLGIPKDPTGYELKRPQLPQGVTWDESFEAAVRPVAHKLGLTPTQLNGLAEFYAGHMGTMEAGRVQSRTTAQATAVQELKAEFGQQFDAQIALAQRAARHFGGDKFIAALDETGFGDNPELIRFMAKIGGMIGEDVLRNGVTSTALSPEMARAEIAQIEANPAFLDKMATGRDALLRRREELYKIVFPGVAA